MLGIVRQESSFDPMARSGAGARGMMQLMPATAQVVARRLGVAGDLNDPSYNMTLEVRRFWASWSASSTAPT